MVHATQFKNPFLRWIDSRLPIISLMKAEYIDFQMPKNVTYLWAFGAISMLVMIIMILTGVFLAMNYDPTVGGAFDSIERIMRDVNYGWLLRYVHANGASMFFLAVYIHTFRGLYYGSYKEPRELLWILGVALIIVMMATAFTGYVLPWGQMSYWAATVITNLFSAFPVVGDPIVTWLWGGFSVGNPTLNRFFALHYLLPFVIFGLVFLHVAALHIVGSNNPKGIDTKGPQDTVNFHPYVTVKDFFAFAVFLIIFAGFVFFAPNFLGHPDNYIPANPMVTPAHIVPEWYFLPYYAILRAIPDKLLGVIAMFGSIFVLFALPWLDRSKVRSCVYRPYYKWFFWVLVLDCLVLGYAGSQPAEGIWVTISRLGTLYYFAHFLILLPILNRIEPVPELPESISEPVLKDGDQAAAAAAANGSMEKA